MVFSSWENVGLSGGSSRGQRQEKQVTSTLSSTSDSVWKAMSPGIHVSECERVSQAPGMCQEYIHFTQQSAPSKSGCYYYLHLTEVGRMWVRRKEQKDQPVHVVAARVDSDWCTGKGKIPWAAKIKHHRQRLTLGVEWPIRVWDTLPANSEKEIELDNFKHLS